MTAVTEKLKKCVAALNEVVDILEKETAATPSLEEVRAVLAELSRNGKTAEVRELLQKHSVNKLSEVNPADYADVLKEAEALNG